jgi:hypothetical protein
MRERVASLRGEGRISSPARASRDLISAGELDTRSVERGSHAATGPIRADRKKVIADGENVPPAAARQTGDVGVNEDRSDRRADAQSAVDGYCPG